VALGAAASLLALAVWGGLAYLNRGVYNPADVIVLLGFALAIPSCIACAVAALILAAIARKQRPSIRDQPEAIARARRDRNMTTVAIALALLPLIAFGIIMLAPR
jgi:ABC-type transport system involved in multi-copper enzyme maturation permease subunit